MGCGRNNKVDNTGTVSSPSNDSGGEGAIMITGLQRSVEKPSTHLHLQFRCLASVSAGVTLSKRERIPVYCLAQGHVAVKWTFCLSVCDQTCDLSLLDHFSNPSNVSNNMFQHFKATLTRIKLKAAMPWLQQMSKYKNNPKKHN